MLEEYYVCCDCLNWSTIDSAKTKSYCPIANRMRRSITVACKEFRLYSSLLDEKLRTNNKYGLTIDKDYKKTHNGCCGKHSNCGSGGGCGSGTCGCP